MSKHIPPHLNANLRACEASLRCLDDIKHDDIGPLQEEIMDRLLLTGEMIAKCDRTKIEELRPLMRSYTELETYVTNGSALSHLHHRIHINTDDAYCIRAGNSVAEGLDLLRAEINAIKNPPANPIAALFKALMGDKPSS